MSCCSPHKKHDAPQPNPEQKQGCCAPSPQPEKSGCCSTRKSSTEQQKPVTITRQMTIEQILGMFPFKAQRLSQEITNAGLHCVGCHAAVWETLEGGMLSHGKTEAEIDQLVSRLNALLEEKIDLSSITITSRAASKFLSILAEEEKQGYGLRFAEEMAGCNGFEYVLDFSEKADAEDEIFHSNGVEIHIKKVMLPRLMGSEIDYVEGLRGSGFKVSNPNVQSACGCGSSHNY